MPTGTYELLNASFCACCISERLASSGHRSRSNNLGITRNSHISLNDPLGAYRKTRTLRPPLRADPLWARSDDWQSKLLAVGCAHTDPLRAAAPPYGTEFRVAVHRRLGARLGPLTLHGTKETGINGCRPRHSSPWSTWTAPISHFTTRWRMPLPSAMLITPRRWDRQIRIATTCLPGGLAQHLRSRDE